MEKLRGDNGKAMDMCVKELREASSNATEMEEAIYRITSYKGHCSEGKYSTKQCKHSLDSERSGKIYARRRQLFEKRNRKVWISLGSDFEEPALQILNPE